MLDGTLLAALADSDEARAVEIWAASVSQPLREFDAACRSSFTGITAAEASTSALFSRFVNGALAADWACYEAEADRADYQRLRAVIAAFPRGFRLWLCRNADGAFASVGYTGWYPITAEAFAKAYEDPTRLTHRRELWPRSALSPNGDYLWLFNYCIVASLRHSAQSREMLQTYATDLAGIPVRGMAAAVLSEESKKVVARFGMVYRGDMTHDGVRENVFAVRNS